MYKITIRKRIKGYASTLKVCVRTIPLFKQYIPVLTEHSQSYHDKKVNNILNDDTLSEDEKQEKLSKIKPPVIYAGCNYFF